MRTSSAVAEGKPTFTAEELASIQDEGGETETDEAALAEVPESADGYVIPAPPKELGERSEADAELIDNALETFQAQGLTKRQATALISWFDRQQVEAAKAWQATVAERQTEAVKTLRAVYVHDYAKNIEMENGLFRQYLSEYMPNQEDRQALLSLRLEDGTMLGSFPPFVQALVDMARAAGRKPGDPSPRRQSLDGMSDADLAKEHRQIMALMHSDEAAYKRAQPELVKIIAAMNQRQRGR